MALIVSLISFISFFPCVPGKVLCFPLRETCLIINTKDKVPSCRSQVAIVMVIWNISQDGNRVYLDADRHLSELSVVARQWGRSSGITAGTPTHRVKIGVPPFGMTTSSWEKRVGGQGYLSLGNRWSRIKKQPIHLGCFLFLDQFSSSCFSSLDTAVNR